MRRLVYAVLVLVFAVPAVSSKSASKFSPDIAKQPKVAAALKYIDEHRAQQLAEWIRITEIPAPSKMEKTRAAYIKAEMQKAGLTEVEIDGAGNCVGVRKGTGGGPAVVFAAHMDTVHPIDTILKVTRDGQTLRAPGVFDNSASCANLLGAIRAIAASGLKTKGDLIFIATVQEELGLQGMRYWLERNRARVGMLVALDGPLGPVSYGALGITWYKFSFTGEGSHTVTSRGKPNPARAVARAIQDIYTIQLPAASDAPGEDQDLAVYNVSTIGGGKITNATPQEAFFTIDIRANDPAVFKSMTERVVKFAQEAARAEKVELKIETMIETPAGGTAKQLAAKREHPLVVTALDVLTYLNDSKTWKAQPIPSGSTDANVGVEMGIPSIATGRCLGGAQHTLAEWADIDSAYIGTKQIILLAVSLAEPAGE